MKGDLKTGHKTIIETLHRMGKLSRMAVHRVLCTIISMESLVEGQNVAEDGVAPEMTVGFN